MVIEVDLQSSQPLYLQIRDQVIAAIATGELECGQGLPSVRSLATDLGINLHTVNKAYAVLRDEGYLVVRGRSGAYVAEDAARGVGRNAAAQDDAMTRELTRLALALKARGGTMDDFVSEARDIAKRIF